MDLGATVLELHRQNVTRFEGIEKRLTTLEAYGKAATYVAGAGVTLLAAILGAILMK